MAGEEVPLVDLDAAALGFDWAEPEPEEESEAEQNMDETLEAGMDADPMEVAAAEAVVAGSASESAAVRSTACSEPAESAEAERWRQRAMELEDQLQWQRDELLQARAETSYELLMQSEGVEDVSVLVEVDDPRDKRKSKHVTLPEFLHECRAKRKPPPTLTPRERLSKEQRKTGVYKGRAEISEGAFELSEKKLACARLELERAKRQHATELELTRQQHTSECKGLRMRHASELALMATELEQAEQAHAAQCKRADDVAEWKRIQLDLAKGHEAQRLQWKDEAHSKQLGQRTARAATWKAKRNNLARALQRSKQRAAARAAELKASAAELKALDADNSALHVELGESVKIADQRQGDHTRAAFTFNTILRDLKTRQHSLNSGAGNVREITRTYSEHIAKDGRDLKLESGSLASVLRWEKRADVVCMLLEGRRLRQALLDEPRTRMHVYVDLSPDCRAVEQCGMGFEYAIVMYVSPDGDAPPPFAEGRLSGEPLSTSATVRFGVDGCPITVESCRRVFAPMLAALGPKYASTCDCFMRMLQVYGSTVGELLDPDFCFATVERHDVAVPLLNRIENFTADAGGEVHKSGGVIDTVTPDASYRHCGAHGGNLSLKRSVGFDRVGSAVRMLSGFCRGGNKHTTLVHHMKCIQQPELYTGKDERLRKMYRDAHEDVKQRGLFHTDLGGSAPSLEALDKQLERLDDLVLVAKSQLESKTKKGTEVRWKYEFEVLHDRLIDVAHLLAPAILIEYGSGETFAELAIDAGTEKTPKNKSAIAALATLRDPTFLFWACHLRLLYTRVYKGLFDAVQANHHHAAPMLAGADGLPMQWAAAMRAGFVPGQRKGDEPRLSPTASAPLVKLLAHFPVLGGATGKHATDAITDLEAQAKHLEDYFAKWRSLEGLVHALAREDILQGPLTEAACELIEGRRCETPSPAANAALPDEPLTEELVAELAEQRLRETVVTFEVGEATLDLTYFDLLPRIPAKGALAAAAEGLRRFEAASAEERNELPGTLPWLLFSPKTRDDKDNAVFNDVKAFAAADVNPHTGLAYPHRCWVELTKVLVAGGAKFCPSTSAQLEGLFNGLTRQQGASKNNITQPQISFEARCRKNDTMNGLTESILRNNWEDARAVQGMLDAKGFWVCDIGLAADRKLSQKLKEQREVELAADGDGDGVDEKEKEQTWEVERITHHEKDRKSGEYIYIVKWKGYESKHNTKEPEAHLIACSALLAYWKGKGKGKKLSKPQEEQVARVTKLHEAALCERQEAETRRRTRPLQREPERSAAPASGTAGSPPAQSRPSGVPDDCRHTYDRAHGALGNAASLTFDTETSGFTGSVLNLGWILADADGKELVTYERLWRLPAGERIHRKAFESHGISEAQLARDGVPAKPELAEFLALVAAAEAADVRLVAHHTSFDVRMLNHTAICQGLAPSLRSASMLCTMHNATRHCGLRKRGGKQAKTPTNEELFTFLFGRKPAGRLHSALPDCRITLASYIEGHKRKWW